MSHSHTPRLARNEHVSIVWHNSKAIQCLLEESLLMSSVPDCLVWSLDRLHMCGMRWVTLITAQISRGVGGCLPVSLIFRLISDLEDYLTLDTSEWDAFCYLFYPLQHWCSQFHSFYPDLWPLPKTAWKRSQAITMRGGNHLLGVTRMVILWGLKHKTLYGMMQRVTPGLSVNLLLVTSLHCPGSLPAFGHKPLMPFLTPGGQTQSSNIEQNKNIH